MNNFRDTIFETLIISDDKSVADIFQQILIAENYPKNKILFSYVDNQIIPDYKYKYIFIIQRRSEISKSNLKKIEKLSTENILVNIYFINIRPKNIKSVQKIKKRLEKYLGRKQLLCFFSEELFQEKDFLFDDGLFYTLIKNIKKSKKKFDFPKRISIPLDLQKYFSLVIKISFSAISRERNILITTKEYESKKIIASLKYVFGNSLIFRKVDKFISKSEGLHKYIYENDDCYRDFFNFLKLQNNSFKKETRSAYPKFNNFISIKNINYKKLIQRASTPLVVMALCYILFFQNTSNILLKYQTQNLFIHPYKTLNIINKVNYLFIALPSQLNENYKYLNAQNLLLKNIIELQKTGEIMGNNLLLGISNKENINKILTRNENLYELSQKIIVEKDLKTNDGLTYERLELIKNYTQFLSNNKNNIKKILGIETRRNYLIVVVNKKDNKAESFYALTVSEGKIESVEEMSNTEYVFKENTWNIFENEEDRVLMESTQLNISFEKFYKREFEGVVVIEKTIFEELTNYGKKVIKDKNFTVTAKCFYDSYKNNKILFFPKSREDLDFVKSLEQM